MPKTLVLTTDLPYFPGKNGHDFFNLRYVARRNAVGVVGPLYDFYPEEGIKNLESVLTGAYLWPRPAMGFTLPHLRALSGRLPKWLEKWSPRRREKLLLRLVGLQDQPKDAYVQLAVLTNCAPQLLSALFEHPWQVLVLIQSNTAPWLDYLPTHLSKLVYFHDVRSHLADRQAAVMGDPVVTAAAVRAPIERQERRVCGEADVVGFVSELDEQRARAILRPVAETGVAPIPVDVDYYTPPPVGWQGEARPIVLFTGHLSHPPNVDAVIHFLETTWPLIRVRCPAALFRVVGCMPASRLAEVCATAGASVQLHGDVADIRPFFWNAAAYVVPMRFGGGVRQKIFEAWLMRVPVICTTMAAEGTRAEHGCNCWLEDDPAGMADRVVACLNGKPPAEILERGARTALENNAIPVAAARFEQLIERTVQIKRQRPYKLLYDLRWMEIGKAGGVEQLAYEQLDAISKLDRHNAYRVLCPHSTYTEWNFSQDFRCKGFYTDESEARVDALHAAVSNRLAKTLKQPPILTGPMRALRYYKKLDFDLVHSINSYIHPDLAAFPQVLTMCDLQHIHFPEFFSTQELAVRNDLYRRSSQAARHIICISEYTRRDLHAQYDVPLEKMTSIWAIPSRAAWIKLENARARGLLAGMGLNAGSFLFYPAHNWGHKNHAGLLSAFAMIAKDLPAQLRLVLTGRVFPPEHSVRQIIAEHRLEKRVLHLGYRSPLEIRALYGGALALVFPSLFEGFGMPVAEAIIAGCPVACSATTSLPEIAGEAAITFDPTSITEIAHALMRISTDAPLRSALVAAGERRRPLFSARLQAIKTLAVYRRVFEEFYGD